MAVTVLAAVKPVLKHIGTHVAVCLILSLSPSLSTSALFVLSSRVSQRISVSVDLSSCHFLCTTLVWTLAKQVCLCAIVCYNLFRFYPCCSSVSVLIFSKFYSSVAKTHTVRVPSPLRARVVRATCNKFLCRVFAKTHQKISISVQKQLRKVLKRRF